MEMKNNTTKLMINCKEASMLIEQKNGVSVTMFEKIKLKIHLLICKACANYVKQHSTIEKFISKYYQTNKNKDFDEKNLHALKMKIINNLEEK